MYVMVIAKLCCKPSPEISESLHVYRPLPESRARVRDNLAQPSQEAIAENPRHFIVLQIAFCFFFRVWKQLWQDIVRQTMVLHRELWSFSVALWELSEQRL